MTATIGRSFGSDTVALLTEEGDWKVTVSMVEKRLLAGADKWDERVVSTSCTDTSFEKAYSVAMDATLQQFQDAINATKSGGLFEELEEETKE